MEKASASVLFFCVIVGSFTCSQRTTSHITLYGGGFLMDSVTVGFIRTQYDESSTTSAWDNPEYSNGRQDLMVYSIPRRTVVETRSLVEGVADRQEIPAVSFRKPWLAYSRGDAGLELRNFETNDRATIAAYMGKPGVFSRNTRYLCYSTPHSTFIYDVQQQAIVKDFGAKTGVLHIDDEGMFCLVTIVPNSSSQTLPQWVGKYQLESSKLDTFAELPDSLRQIWRITDSHRALAATDPFATGRMWPRYYSLDSLLGGNIRPMNPSILPRYVDPRSDVDLRNGSYVESTSDGIAIGNIRNSTEDAQFTQMRSK